MQPAGCFVPSPPDSPVVEFALPSSRRRMPTAVRTRFVLMLALAVAVACSSPRNADRAATPAASERRSAVPGAQRPDGAYMLYSFPASKSGDLTYEIVLAPCGAPACPLQVRLLAGETVVDTASVEWESVVAAP